jgi:Effector protein
MPNAESIKELEQRIGSLDALYDRVLRDIQRARLLNDAAQAQDVINQNLLAQANALPGAANPGAMAAAGGGGRRAARAMIDPNMLQYQQIMAQHQQGVLSHQQLLAQAQQERARNARRVDLGMRVVDVKVVLQKELALRQKRVGTTKANAIERASITAALKKHREENKPFYSSDRHTVAQTYVECMQAEADVAGGANITDHRAAQVIGNTRYLGPLKVETEISGLLRIGNHIKIQGTDNYKAHMLMLLETISRTPSGQQLLSGIENNSKNHELLIRERQLNPFTGNLEEVGAAPVAGAWQKAGRKDLPANNGRGAAIGASSLSNPVSASGAPQVVQTAALPDAAVGDRLVIDVGTFNEEIVQILASDPENQTFRAVFTKNHRAGAPVVRACTGEGTNMDVAISPGETMVNNMAPDQPLPEDAILFHEMVHGLHGMRGEQNNRPLPGWTCHEERITILTGDPSEKSYLQDRKYGWCRTSHGNTFQRS